MKIHGHQPQLTWEPSCSSRHCSRRSPPEVAGRSRHPRPGSEGGAPRHKLASPRASVACFFVSSRDMLCRCSASALAVPVPCVSEQRVRVSRTSESKRLCLSTPQSFHDGENPSPNVQTFALHCKKTSGSLRVPYSKKGDISLFIWPPLALSKAHSCLTHRTRRIHAFRNSPA